MIFFLNIYSFNNVIKFRIYTPKHASNNLQKKNTARIFNTNLK